MLEKLEVLKKKKIAVKTKHNDINIKFELPNGVNDLNISELLPFLDEEKINEVVQEKLKGTQKYKNLKLLVLLPFVSSETADKLFMEYLKDENKKATISIRSIYFRKCA